MGSKMKFKHWLFIIITVALGVSLLFNAQISAFVNTKFFKDNYATNINGELVLHFIDVGQGDAILVELPDDRTMLVDAGPSSGEDKLEKYLSNFFKNKGNKTLDFFVLTHSDEDHVGGSDVVYDMLDVQYTFRPNIYSTEEIAAENLTGVKEATSVCYQTFIDKIDDENCKQVYVNQVFESMPQISSSCGYQIEFLGPVSEYYDDVNDYSPFILITYNNVKTLLTGDAEKEAEEQAMANNYADLNVDILKIGHHGSNSSTTTEFLKATTPKYAIICVGEGNRYKHPTEDTLARLEEFVVSSRILRTDLNGNIVMSVNKDLQENDGIEILLDAKPAPFVFEWWYAALAVELAVFSVVFGKNVFLKRKK